MPEFHSKHAIGRFPMRDKKQGCGRLHLKIVKPAGKGEAVWVSASKSADYFICPNCGEEVRVGSSSCPNCGSDEKTGWNEDDDYSHINLPSGYSDDDDFDYDEFVRREFGGGSGRKFQFEPRTFLRNAVIIALAAAMIWLFVFR